MGKKDARVDAYIAKSAAFAQPILTALREQVHAACPDVEETIKWSMPFFDYDGPLCHMAAFKAHCAFGLWNSRQVVEGEAGVAPEADGKATAMGQFGRIESMADLPSKKEFAALVKKAMALKAAGVKAPRMQKTPKPALPVPDDLAKALKKNAKAGAVFEAFPPGKRREYIEWITEAKTEATRAKRLDQAIEWIAEGKSRNWKYANC